MPMIPSELLNTVINLDCLEVMKSLPDKCIELILTDPPYGIDIAKSGGVGMSKKNDPKWRGGHKTTHEEKGWDVKLEREYFDEMIRISKNQIIFGGNYYADWLPPSRCWLIWDKKNDGTPYADAELAWTSFDSSVRIFRWIKMGFFHEPGGKEKNYHPTQKPLELMKWCLQNYSEEGMTVLDPFAGSGTTGRACKDMNRNYILIEKEADYCEIIKKRLEQEVLL